MQTETENTHPTEVDERRPARSRCFRYGVIAHGEPSSRTIEGADALLVKEAAQEYTIPGSLRRHVAAETMRGWLRTYRRGGFDGAGAAPACRPGQLPVHPCAA